MPPKSCQRYPLIKYGKAFIVLLIVGVVLRALFRREDLTDSFEKFQEDINTSIDPADDEQLFPNINFKPVFLKKDFKRDDSYSEGIPRIIHQIWDNHEVPKRFLNWIKTWKSMNPDWEHWFWTLDDARKLIETHYPSYLVLYNSYLSSIFRADAARYFIIHYYGGIYVDLDMSCLQPLDNWTQAYDCIISEEPYEHSFVIREQNDTNVLNGFIACKEEHPFLQLTMESLEKAAGFYFGDYLEATGPIFFNGVYQNWFKKEKKTYVTQSEVLVLPPKFFFPTYDRSESGTISSKCHPKSLKFLNPRGQALCKSLILRSFSNEVTRWAYTDHDWLHSYMFGESFKNTNTMHITNMVPSIKLASNILII